MRYAFGPFRLDTSTLELKRDGETVSVEPQVFGVLVYLIENRDRVLSKDDLIEAVWGGRIVSDAAISSRIRLVRRAVDDDGTRQAVIKTVHGKGFRFVAELEDAGSELEADIEPDPVPPPLKTRPAASQRPNRILTPLGLAAIGLLGLFLVFQLFPSQDAANDPRIAVLPVANETGDPGLDWVELGLMSLVIHDLEVRSELPLVPARTIMTLSDRFVEDAGDGDTLVPPEALKDALREGYSASHILISRLGGTPDNLTLEYRMINPRGQSPPARVSGQRAAELAAEMSRQVAANLPRSGERRIDVPVHMFDDVYVAETYARGRDLQMKGLGAEAADMFRAAAAQDPDNLTIQYELAVSTRIAGNLDEAETQLNKLVQTARDAGDMDVHGAALNGLGVVHMIRREDEAARQSFQAALEVWDGSENDEKRAISLSNLGVIHRRLRDFEDAEEVLGQALVAYQSAGFETPPGQLFNAFALLKAQTRDIPKSNEYLMEALAAFRLVGDRRAEAVALHNLGANAHKFGEFYKAATLLSDALALRRQMDDSRGILSSLSSLAMLAADRGNTAEGAIYAEEVLQLARAAGDAYQIAQAESLASHIDFVRGDWAAAEAHSRASEDAYAGLSRTRNVVHEQISQAVIRGYGGSADGLDVVHNALAWAEAEGQQGTALVAHEAFTMLHMLSGNYDQAADHIDSAVALSNELHLSAVTGRIAARQGLIRLIRGDLTGATASLGRAKAGFANHQETVLLEGLLELSSGKTDLAANYIAEAKTIAGDSWHLSERLFHTALDGI